MEGFVRYNFIIQLFIEVIGNMWNIFIFFYENSYIVQFNVGL